MSYIEGWFLEVFGNDVHADPYVIDSNDEKNIEELVSRIEDYVSELHKLNGMYYLCFFHESEKNKLIKSKIFVLKTIQFDDFLKLASIEIKDIDDIEYLAGVYLDVKKKYKV